MDSKILKKNDNKNKEKNIITNTNTNKIKLKTRNNKIKNKDIFKKNNGGNILEQKLNSKSSKNKGLTNSTSKKEIRSYYEDVNTSIFQNPNSQFNNYILNLNKDNILFSQKYLDCIKRQKNEKKIINDDFNLILNNKNNKSEYYNTETFSSNISSLFKTKLSNSNSKIYDNYLYNNYKYNNLGNKEKKRNIS